MPSKYKGGVPEDVLKEASENASGKPNRSKPPDVGNNAAIPKESRQRRLFKRKRAGVVLTREQVKEIKAGRKKLRADMKARGIKDKREFEAVASSLGLYFDKRNKGFLAWLFGHWLGALIAALAILLFIILIFAAITRMRGYYTVNLSDGLFRNGFVLSETEDFANPAIELFAEPAENIPCISIKHIPANVDKIDGQHNETYFAYTYYIRNEGEDTVDFTWELELNSESKDLSTAAWIALYVDGQLGIYAEKNAAGEAEAIPPYGITDKGYKDLPLASADSEQFEIVKKTGDITYYRVVPYGFETENIIKSGRFDKVKPKETHKYTVVIWLEGDDPEADNSKIGGHVGLQMNFRLIEEDRKEKTFSDRLREFFGFR